MTTQTTRTGREFSQCDYCGKKGRPRPFDDGFEWIGAPGWSAAPYPGRTLHRCPTCQTSPAPLLPEPLAWWRALVAGAPVEPDADGVEADEVEPNGPAAQDEPEPVAPDAVRCTRCQHDASEHAAGHAECYVCPCARLLHRNDDDVDVEVGPSAELLRLTYNALVVQQVSGALDRAGLSRLEAARRAGIDPVTFARRMTGGTFTIAELGALADACGVRASVWLRHVDNTLADARKVAS